MTRASIRTVRIAHIVREALDICSFELVDPDGAGLPCFSAGSHIEVHLPNGLVRQYSLCNDPGETYRYQIAVLRDPASRGGSAAMHDLVEGQLIHISEPKNHFELAADTKRSLLLAGGIGITPILSMAAQLESMHAEFELHYCTRSRERTAFVDRLTSGPLSTRAHLHHDDEAPRQKLDIANLFATQEPGTHLYVCGPTGFMAWVLDAARTAGWPEEQLHREYFAGAPIDTSRDGSFEVQLASTGAVFRIAADQTIVAALAAQGIQLQTSCEQGICGTCLTRVLDGIPDHRDMYLTPDEQANGNQFTPCCSRAKSARLLLDL